MVELVQLGELIERVRVEQGVSLNPAHSVQQRGHIVGLLNRIQRDIASDSDWDVLDAHVTVDMLPGVWTYDIPNVMNFEKMRLLYVRDGASIHEIKKGFGPVQFVQSDPTAGAMDWPVRRWRLAASSIHSIDLWPAPDRAAKLEILGQKIPTRMSDDEDFSSLDADVLALRAAANMLAKTDPSTARVKLDAADRRIISLRADQSSNKGEDIVLGGGLRGQFRNPSFG
jgi:hypothetical protein